jgi:phage FluMu protein Com
VGISSANIPMIEQRCCNCGSLLAKGQISAGKIAIKCKCGVINTIIAEPDVGSPKNKPYQERFTPVRKAG